MKKLVDVITLTAELNMLRMRNQELGIIEFREKISKLVGYNMFSSILLEEGYAYSINNRVHFSPTPIHKSKVENILKEARELQYKYTKAYTDKKKGIKEKEEKKKQEIQKAIALLKENGFIVIKPENVL